MKKTTRTAVICMAISAAGTLEACSGDTGPATNSSSVLSGVLAELNDGGKFFTFAYVDVPPEGLLLKISALSSSREPCLLFGGPDSPSSKPEDGWLLNVMTSGTSTGTYQVFRDFEPNVGLSSQARVAYAELVLLRGGERVGTYRALGGDIIVNDAPSSEEEFATDGPVEVVANLVFPTVPVGTESCAGGGAGTSGATEVTCQCIRGFKGDVYTCSSTGPESCCYDDVGEVENVSITLDALPCAAACAYTRPELAQYCASIQ